MKASQQIFTSRIIVMIIFFISLSIALNSSEKILSLGSFALSISCQMLIPLLALCYFRWLTGQGVALGLVVGIIFVFLTDDLGQVLLGDVLPWNKWPFTIHSSVWGLFFNLLATLSISFITQDTKEDNYKFKFHDFISEYKATSLFRRS